jgi:hypothetical protein
VIGRGRGNPDPFLCDEFAVLILQINKRLASDRWKKGVSHVRAVREPVHPGKQVTVNECLVVDRLEGRIGSVLPELFLHAPDHRDGPVSGSELGGGKGQHGRRDEQGPKNKGSEMDRGKTHGSSFDGPGLVVQWAPAKGDF